MNQAPYRFFALGESAISIEFSTTIDDIVHERILALAEKIRREPFVGLQDVVPAYTTLGIFYNVVAVRRHYPAFKNAFEFVEQYLQTQLESDFADVTLNRKTQTIPVRYNGEDLTFVCDFCKIDLPTLIQLHTAPLYKVYMIGFLPGFPYLGGLDERLQVPRKTTPRLKVAAGSVGLAGQQTGIYPQASPGGWQLIGRTDVVLFSPEKNPPTLLQAGDWVKFEAI